MKALYDVASQGGRILFVGTKFQAFDIIASEAIRCGQYYVNHRWLGGMLTNWGTVSSSIKTLMQYEKILNDEDSILTKKELGNIEKKKQKLDKALGGIREMGAIPDILFIIDTNKEHIAVKEAKKLGIPIVAILDTNSDPGDITYLIPGNDDSRKSIELYCKLATDSILAGIESSLARSGVKIDNIKGDEFIQEKEDSIVQTKRKRRLGLSDCKKALEECDGDIKKAVDKLRTIGLAKADKKSDRVASDGLVAMCLTENYGALVELNCETDFVARNEKFIELVSNLASIAHQERCISVDELKNAKYESIGTVQEAIMNGTSVLGEKLELSKLCYLETKDGVVAGYVHGDVRGLGKTGALVALQSPGDKAKLQEIGKQIAMHIVAMKPEALSIDDLDQMKLKNERSIIEEQVRSLNKPEEVAKKIVDGRMAKYYEEVVLLEQKFIKDDKMKVSDFIKSSEVSAIKLSDYKLLVLGSAN
ncbi:elongation factor Ts [Trichonephila inaurata madagascariensis]|uniref:Elongation factor Ts, mitochondrial n=1 Tax=Trichonephila inaurata madagascariensis TaxID=2747483 RepID=A0A8X7CU86_9ARAC|nr:elongation factor Ts [Trichonephila inaurata madagascariensis]